MVKIAVNENSKYIRNRMCYVSKIHIDRVTMKDLKIRNILISAVRKYNATL